MKILKKTILLSFAICFLFGLIFALSFNNTKSVYAAANNADPATIDDFYCVGDLWDYKNSTFDKTVFNNLVAAVTNNNNMDFESLSKNILEQKSALTSTDFRTFNGGKDIALKLTRWLNTGIDVAYWTPTYLSYNKDGDLILTLFQLDKKDGAGFAFSGNYSSRDNNNPASAIYGASYMRAQTLGNQGKYLTGNGELATATSSDYWFYYDFFADDSWGINKFIATPETMQWQENGESAKAILGYEYNLSNENWSNNISNDGFYSADMNFASKYPEYNSNWKGDILWLPSLSEVGVNDQNSGLWQLSYAQRRGIYNDEPHYSTPWFYSSFYSYRLRSAHSKYNYSALSLSYYDTEPEISEFVTDVNVIGCCCRACLHLNLTKADKSIKVDFSNASVENNYTLEYNGLNRGVDVKYSANGKQIVVDPSNYKLVVKNHATQQTAQLKDVGEYDVEIYPISAGMFFYENGAHLTTFVTITPKKIVADMVQANSVFEYTGSAITPDIKITILESNFVVPKSEYTVKYSNNINTGLATATITGNGNLDTTAYVHDFTIETANNAWITEYSRSNWRSGNSASAEVMPKAKFGQPTITYYTDKACTKPYTGDFNDAEVGTYYAKVVVEGTENYTKIEKIYLFEIYRLTTAEAVMLTLIVLFILSLTFGAILTAYLVRVEQRYETQLYNHLGIEY